MRIRHAVTRADSLTSHLRVSCVRNAVGAAATIDVDSLPARFAPAIPVVSRDSCPMRESFSDSQGFVVDNESPMGIVVTDTTRGPAARNGVSTDGRTDKTDEG